MDERIENIEFIQHQLNIHIRSIRSLAKQRRRKSIRARGIIFAIFTILFLVAYFLQPLIARVIIIYILPMAFGFLIIDFKSIFDPLNSNEKAFSKIYNTINLLIMSESNSNFINRAHKNFNDAIKCLEKFNEYDAPWNSKINEINKKFIFNLKMRISPAILKGEINHEEIQEIASLFINSDISNIEIFNKKVEYSYKDEIIENDIERKNKFIEFTSSIYSNIFAKLISSIAGGFLSAFSLSEIYLYFTGDEIYPQTIFGTGAALSIIFAQAVSLTQSKNPKFRIKNGRPEFWVEEPLARAMEKGNIRHIRLLREKMDKFYSPLFGNRNIFHVGDRERTKREFIDPFMEKYLIRDKYPTMASERLSELLEKYFHMGEIDIRREHGKPDDKWKALLDEIKETIEVDFEELKNDIARAQEISGDTAIQGKWA